MSRAGINCRSVPLTQHKTTNNPKEERSNKMAHKKAKKIKVRDLKPAKDAKGGGGGYKPKGPTGTK
jgi:hypothetical protein